MAKVLCVLYDDPVDGMPKKYARDDVPAITKYHDGQSAPTPKAIDFKPDELLGGLIIRPRGHEGRLWVDCGDSGEAR